MPFDASPQDEFDEPTFDDQKDVDAGELFSLSDDLEEWAGADLEAAYLKAMSALEASDLEVPHRPVASDEEHDVDQVDRDAESKALPAAASDTGETGDNETAMASLAALRAEITAPVAPNPDPAPLTEARLTPRQIIEACLFVGGEALTLKKLASTLRGDFDADYVDREINELNRLYAAENRPYEIRLGDGGYRLALREEFERIRHKVYGLGPKEVRLSQEALEVLAVVAYHQPIQQKKVEELGKPACGAVLRQLVRRELLAVERNPEAPREVSYVTTSRFLSLFGIRNLDELPRHEQIAYK